MTLMVNWVSASYLPSNLKFNLPKIYVLPAQNHQNSTCQKTFSAAGVVALKEELLKRNICLAKETFTDYRLTPESMLSTLNELFNDTVAQRVEVVVLVCAGPKVDKFLRVCLFSRFLIVSLEVQGA